MINEDRASQPASAAPDKLQRQNRKLRQRGNDLCDAVIELTYANPSRVVELAHSLKAFLAASATDGAPNRCGNYAEHQLGPDGKGCVLTKGHDGNCTGDSESETRRTREPQCTGSGTYQTSQFTKITPSITLGCISPEARDLLERVMDEWEKHLAALKSSNGADYEPEYYGFAYWLIRWSGLVQPVSTSERSPSGAVLEAESQMGADGREETGEAE